MQNQNQNTGLIFPDNQTPQSAASLDATSNSQALLNTPEPAIPLDTTPVIAAPAKKQNILVRLARRVDIILAILLVLGSIGVVFIKTAPTATNTNLGEFENTKLPLDGFADSSSIILDTRSVKINGSLVLAPSSQPNQAEAGQLYYDQTGNTLSYYNGTDFVALASGDASVVSLQGQTGSVTLNGGPGIAISGTTISNAGVISLTAGNNSLIITDDGAGNHTLTVGPATVTLQAAYDAGNIIQLSSGRRLAVQDSGADVFSISPSGGAVLLRSSINSTTALQVQTAGGTGTVLGVDTTNQRVGINTAAPSWLLQANQNNLTPGTVSNSASSASVTGAGTTFLTTFQPGDTFTITSSGNSCTVLQITSDTALVCRSALATASNGSAYSFTQQERFSVANTGTTILPGTVILSNPYNASARFSFRSDTAANNLTIGANVIGNPSDDGGSDTNTDYIQASVFNSGTGGTIDSIRVCFTTMDPTDNGFKVAVYTDNAGSPGTLLSAASPSIGTGAVGWSTASLGTTVTLAPNTNYWLAHTTQVGVTTRYCRQDGGTTKYQGSFPWGTNFPANYNTTDITSTTIGAYAPYVTITDHSATTSAIKVTENNEVAIRPLYNSDTAFQVLRKDGSVTMSVNNFDRYMFANQMMVGGADVNYRMFLIGNDTNGVIGARRTSNTATDSIMELFSDVGGAATLQLKVQADGTLRLGNPTADGTGALLVLDTKNTSGDPTGVNGSMYYNSNSNTFRCHENSVWYDCISRHKIVLGSDAADSSGACTNTDITGLSFSVSSGQIYRFYAHIEYTAAATTTGSAWSATGPTNNFFSLFQQSPLTGGTMFGGGTNGSDSGQCSTDTSSTAGNVATLSGTISPTANGTVQLRMATEVDSSAITARAGSTLEWW